jgi:hypothetical protein
MTKTAPKWLDHDVNFMIGAKKERERSEAGGVGRRGGLTVWESTVDTL